MILETSPHHFLSLSLTEINSNIFASIVGQIENSKNQDYASGMKISTHLSISAIAFSVAILQVFVAIFNLPNRWNEILGVVLSLSISISWFICPNGSNKNEYHKSNDTCRQVVTYKSNLEHSYNSSYGINTDIEDLKEERDDDDETVVGGIYKFLVSLDLLVLSVNTILLIYHQWIILQYCIYLNIAVSVPEDVSCYDWWHFGKSIHSN